MLQVALGLSLALLVLRIPRGQAALRIAAILPIVLAPVVVGLFWRTLVLAPDVGLVDVVTRSLGLGSHNWLGDPQLALISVIAIHTWQWTPFAFLVLLASLSSLPPDVFEAARIDRASAWQRFRHITLPLIRPAIVIVVIMRTMIALSAFAAIFAATGGGPGTATEILNLYAYRTSFTELNLGYGASLADGAARDHARRLVRDVPRANEAMSASNPVSARRLRTALLVAVAALLLAVWAFPVLWALLTSFKTERDVLAYPPTVIFEPTLANYRDVMFGSASLLPNLLSSPIVAGVVDAADDCSSPFPPPMRSRASSLPAKRASGFYVLATQMLPPVGLIIPYYLVLQKLGGLDTYAGLIVIYLTFSLPFAIWLMVSYFEDIPREMEEAALLDRAGRLRALWHVILPQVRGGIAVTTIFVFLNAWNEFLFAVVLGGNRVRPVTVAMFNFISVEQTLWAKLAAGAMLAMAPVILLGLLAQRHIVKGLTVGAVKGGGRT